MWTHQAPRPSASACRNLEAPSKSVGLSLLFRPPFPNLIGEAQVDEAGEPSCTLLEIRSVL
jgi:hypothetical protein